MYNNYNSSNSTSRRMMYNDNDETYDNDDNVIWNDERLIRPRSSVDTGQRGSS